MRPVFIIKTIINQSILVCQIWFHSCPVSTAQFGCIWVVSKAKSMSCLPWEMISIFKMPAGITDRWTCLSNMWMREAVLMGSKPSTPHLAAMLRHSMKNLLQIIGLQRLMTFSHMQVVSEGTKDSWFVYLLNILFYCYTFLPLGFDDYWTGYFTSRPSFKYHERISNNLLQAAKQIDAMSVNDSSDQLTSLKQALGIAQHHDAITGTAKQHVDSDYNARLR